MRVAIVHYSLLTLDKGMFVNLKKLSEKSLLIIF
jgi:hypothetical protein